MKIVTRAELMKCDKGTVFCEINDGWCQQYQILDGLCGEDDFFAIELNPSVCVDGGSDVGPMLAGKSSAFTPSSGSDGLFEEDQMYLILERQDRLELLSKLNNFEQPKEQ